MVASAADRMVLALHWFFTRFILVMVNFACGSLQSTFIPDTINSGCRPSVDILCILAGGGYVDAFLLHVASPLDYITFARAYTTALPFFFQINVSVSHRFHTFSRILLACSRAHRIGILFLDSSAPMWCGLYEKTRTHRVRNVTKKYIYQSKDCLVDLLSIRRSPLLDSLHPAPHWCLSAQP